MSDETLPSLLETLTTVVATRTLTDYMLPVTVSFRFPVAPVLVPVGPAAEPAPMPLTAAAAAQLLWWHLTRLMLTWQSHKY